MSWIEKLYQTYENNTDKIGNPNDKFPLLPLFHTTKKRAHVEVVIDGQGVLQQAFVIAEDNAKTILPATESSAGRTSGCAPHPLADQLQYVASEYNKYGGTKSHYFHSLLVKFKGNEKFFKSLMFDGGKDKQGFLSRILTENKKLIDTHEKFSKKKQAISAIIDADIRQRQTDQIYYNLIDLNSPLIRKNKKQQLSEKKREQKEQHIELMRRIENSSTFSEKGKNYLKADILDFIYPLIERGYIGYFEVLEEWAESDFANEKIKAVYKYISKGKLITDLAKKKILYVDEKGILTKKWKGKLEEKPKIFKALGQGQNQTDTFIRWSVNIPGNSSSELQFDKDVWQSWIDYYLSTRTKKTFCYITGESKPEVPKYQPEQYPRMIRSDNDGAKIISSNDTSGFTFRGRFTDEYQTCGVDVVVAQEAHSALRWLIGGQGKVFYVKNDPQLAVVAWAVSGIDIPNLLADSDDLLNDGSMENEDKTTEGMRVGFTAQSFGVRLSQYLSGYNVKLDNTDEIIVMGIDSATPGRMAITYYRELTGSEFLTRIEAWHKGCAWLQHFSKDKEFYGAPSPRDIAEATYGTKDDHWVKVEDNLQKITVERLIPCIIDGTPLPWDIVDSCVRKASQRQSLPDLAWQKILGIACGLYRYYFKEKEVYTMGLDRERKTRDYLYGRLLAVADCIESWALKEANDKRQTNAARLMQRFADHPCDTWRTIALGLTPYKARMGALISKHLVAEEEIMNAFDIDDFNAPKHLTGEFLLGFHCQRSELHKSKKSNTQENDDELNK